MKKKETEEEKMNTELDISKFHCSNELIVDNLSKSSEKNRKKKRIKKKNLYIFFFFYYSLFLIFTTICLKRSQKAETELKEQKKLLSIKLIKI